MSLLSGPTFEPKHVLVDGDIVAYRAGFASEGKTSADAEDKVDEVMNFIASNTMSFPVPDRFHTFLTGADNFRFEIAKSYPYKGNRSKSEKPEHLQHSRDYLVSKYKATISYGEEADDLIAKAATKYGPNTVVASVDKDMLQIPCWHYNFGRDEWSQVDEWGGSKFFYTQILTGDAADNIKGIKGVGPVKAGKLLKDCTTEEELWYACLEAYDGDYDRVVENARLLWLRRREEELWEPPTVRDGDTQ